MFKKLVLSLLLVSPFSAQAMIVYPQGVTCETVQQSPKQFGLDYHNVLTAQNSSAYYWSWIKGAPAMASALAKFGFSKLTGIKTAPALAVQEIKQLPKEAKSSGEAIINIFNKYGLTGLASFIVNIKNSYKPVQPMVSLLQRIKTLNPNIIMRIASNMGPQILRNSQETIKPNPFTELLSQGQIVDYSKYGNAPEIQSTEQLSTEPKSNPEFYRTFERNFNSEEPKKVTILVDDKLSNVQAAAQQGLVGVHFDRTKENAMDIFEKNLTTLGIKVR